MTVALPERLRGLISSIADLSHRAPPVCAILLVMRGLRQFMRTRSSGGLLAVCVAYSLAIQALMASVGLGMSAAAAPGDTGFFICSLAAGPGAHRRRPAATGKTRPATGMSSSASSRRKAPAMSPPTHDGPAFPGYVGIPIPAAALALFRDRAIRSPVPPPGRASRALLRLSPSDAGTCPASAEPYSCAYGEHHALFFDIRLCGGI